MERIINLLEQVVVESVQTHTVVDGFGNLIYFPLTILLLPSCLDISDSMTIDGKAYGANKILEYIQKRDQDYVILLKSNMCNH